jgi:hypothetical protein
VKPLLDTAWEDAEAALPVGWRFEILRRRYVGERGSGGGWSATAVQAGLSTEDRRHGTVPSIAGYGASPADALHHLATRLRERNHQPEQPR